MLRQTKCPTLRENLHTSASGGRGAGECTGHCTDLEPPLVRMRPSQGPPESTGSLLESCWLLETAVALERVRGFISLRRNKNR